MVVESARGLYHGVRRRVWLLPHEWLHYRVLRPYGDVTILYQTDHPSKASVVATFESETPPLVIRFGAIAPTLVYTVAAILVDLAVPLRLTLLSPAMVVGFPILVCWIKWAHPSPADLSICWNARYFAAKGSLTIDYEMSWWPMLGSALIFIGLTLYGSWILVH